MQPSKATGSNKNVSFIDGDWGLGIGDWAIPNPQSPIPKFK